MNINWTKWILERLPFAMRVNRLYVLCLLVTLPVRLLYASFLEWSRTMRRKAGATPQVCMLKKVVYDELGFNIEIEEGDGKPFDFIVKTVSSDINKERQLLALLDRYKLAGKSYDYVNTQVAFTNEWQVYVCERNTIFVNWSKYICEGKYKPVNHLYCRVSNTVPMVNAEFAVASDLMIRFVTGIERPGPIDENTPGVVVLRKGIAYGYGRWDSSISLVGAVIYSPYDREDNIYKYVIVWQ